MRCLSSAKFSMLMDLVRPQDAPDSPGGHWAYIQNPDSGAIVRTWVVDNTSTPGVEGKEIKNIPCFAKSALGNSIRSIEQFDAEYINDEWISISVSSMTNVTLRDKVRNIRTIKGRVIWSEEESDNNLPTIFDIYRVNPSIDAFGNVIEKNILAKRAEVQ
jgi:hypothetical protein